MKKLAIPVCEFNLRCFVDTFVTFWGDAEKAFLSVGDDGMAESGIWWMEEEELAAHGLDESCTDPLLWLEKGVVLFAPFVNAGSEPYECADGSNVELPSDCDESEQASDNQDAIYKADVRADRKRIRSLVDKTDLDDLTSYGFLVSIKKGKLLIKTALLREFMGELVVKPIRHAGIFEESMVRFLEVVQRR